MTLIFSGFRRFLTLSALALLTGCASPLPPGPEPSPGRSNTQTAADFQELFFRLESGRSLPVFTRYEGPVRLAVRGPLPQGAGAELDAMLVRLRREAGIDITRSRRTDRAQMIIEFIPQEKMREQVPEAACFVVPGVRSWSEFTRSRNQGLHDWAKLSQRGNVALFIPRDTALQDLRDCLHEEVAQALGPLNDLWHLSDSIFNDDNFHGTLTDFDMLVLKLAYQPELRSGMTRAEVAARLPALLERLNPRGGAVTAPQPVLTPDAFSDQIKLALTIGLDAETRHKAARSAVDLATRAGWQDNRRAFAHYIAARQGMLFDPGVAVEDLAAARRFYGALPAADLHIALVDLQMAGFFLAADVPEATQLLAEQAGPALMRAGNSAAAALLLLMRAEAHARLGQTARAAALRLDSQPLARYGFGPKANPQAQIAAIGRSTAAGQP